MTEQEVKRRAIEGKQVSARTQSKASKPAMAGLDLRNLLMGHYSGSLVKGWDFREFERFRNPTSP